MSKALTAPPSQGRTTQSSAVASPESAGTGRAVALLQVSAATAVLLGAPSLAYAAYIPPTGVSAYRLVFVTADPFAANSTNIADYNADVTAEAAMDSSLPVPPGTVWTVIGSTALVSAATNIDCGSSCDGVPIYALNGSLVAASTSALLGGSHTGIPTDQYGNPANFYVWTGSEGGGTAATGDELGSNYPVLGVSGSSDDDLLDIGLTSFSEDSYALYAISDEITTGVPEPASTSALLLGGLIVTRAFRRRRR